MKGLVVVGAAFLAASAAAEETRVLETLKDKVSYGLGVTMARNFQRQGITADPELVMKGLTDGLSDGPLLVPEDELRVIMGAFQHELNRRKVLAREKAAEDNEKQGAAFLAENAGEDGVVALPSGLQYLVLEAGEGETPTLGDTVECNYRGTLLDGTELDRSEPGKPATFKVASVIPGWREALQRMPAGSKWRLFVPPHLAYGEKGADARIGPHATLIFELELVSIRDSDDGGKSTSMRTR